MNSGHMLQLFCARSNLLYDEKRNRIRLMRPVKSEDDLFEEMKKVANTSLRIVSKFSYVNKEKLLVIIT